MSTTDGPGGGGSPNADKFSLEQMIAIAKADKSNNDRTREQAEGAKLAEEVLADMHRVLSEKTKELRKNFSSPADSALYSGLDRAIPSLNDAATSAGGLKSALESAADTVDRNYDKMSAYETEQASLDSSDPKDLKPFADPNGTQDGYSVLSNDILTDARNDFRTEDDNFLDHKMDLTSSRPGEYVGPKWEGREPRVPLDDTVDGYYADGSPYGRGGAYASGGPGGTYSSNGSTDNGPTPGSGPDSDGPELQTPGGPNAPVTTGPGPGPTTPGTAPPTGGGNPPPTFVPSTTNTSTFPGKTVTPPPANQRPSSANPTARPTPGMSRPVAGPGGGRTMNPTATGKPMPSTGRGYNAAPKNSLLPNQRQAATGRTPVTGSGRMPSTMNAAGNPRGNAPGGTRGGGARPGQSVTPPRKPNAGFEEQTLRHTRAGRTVPGVIGGRQAGAGQSPASSARSVSPRISAAGKVFGQRANQGRPTSAGPKLQSGSLTDTTRKAKKDTRYTWQRGKPEASTSLPSGSMAVTRITGARPTTADELAAAARDKRRAKRRELWKRQERGEASPIPASELFDGTEGKTTRSVITGSKPVPPVDRSQSGRRFGTYGYED